ncbi:MAG: beta-galactosidase [Armatimonadota bacterium]
MNFGPIAGIFPFGSHLCREPMPSMSELKKDMESLKRHGFNMVKLQEQWGMDEPEEGHYDFSRYEELIAHAASLDLVVYLGLTCEQAPGWLWRKHPDCRMVGINGLPILYEAQTPLPADGKPGPCFDHPGALADQARFIKKLVQTLGGYEKIIWNTWQEIGYWSERIVGQPVCYCPHTLRAFQSWLEQRYGDLDALNRAWNSRYREWSAISPQRTENAWTALDVHWKYFMDNVQVANVLRSRAAAIREADALKRPVFAHLGTYTAGSGRDWTYARCQDFLGCSSYPTWFSLKEWDDERVSGKPPSRHESLLTEMWDAVALEYDLLRSCNVPGRPVWAAEFQGGRVSDGFHLGRVPSPDDIRRWMLTAIGSGVTAISFWVTRAEIAAAEADGFSLLDSEGDSTPRYEEASRVGRALNQHPDLFGQPSWPGADVAILVDEWNYQYCATMRQGGEHLAFSARGWHRLLWEASVPVDFVEVSHLGEVDMARYRAAILPFPLCLGEGTVERLAQYVASGGSLISEACPGRISQYSFANRGELSPAARELFGVSHQSVTMVSEPKGGARWSPRERSWGEYLDDTFLTGAGPLEGAKVRANVYVETFSCRGSEPVLMLGEAVAGTVREVAKGRAWLLGTYVGHNGTAYVDDGSRAFVSKLLAACAVSSVSQGRLLMRRRRIEGKEAWLFTNPTAARITERIDVSGWPRVEDLLGEPLPRAGTAVDLTVAPLDVRVLVVQR